MPNLTTAAARYVDRIRVTFSGALADLSTGVNGALNPANWDLDGQASGTGLDAFAKVKAATVVQITTSVLDLLLDQPCTFGRTYQVTAKAASAGGITGVPDPPDNKATFVALTPQQPAGRDFDYSTLAAPQLNRAEDDTKDLVKFVSAMKDLVDIQLHSVDRWTDIFDYERASEGFLDLLLQAMGDPFAEIEDLSELEKRRLLSTLVGMYRLKGTRQGIENVIKFFLGYESDVLAPDRSYYYGSFVIGRSYVGRGDTIGANYYHDIALHGPDVGNIDRPYKFHVKIGTPMGVALTVDEDRKARFIIEYMKAHHETLVFLLTGLPPPATAAAAAGVGQVTISWAAVTGAAGYTVFWAKKPLVTPLSPDGVVDPDNVSPYVQTVPTGETRYYVVCARSAGGVLGVASPMVSATAT